MILYIFLLVILPFKISYYITLLYFFYLNYSIFDTLQWYFIIVNFYGVMKFKRKQVFFLFINQIS